VVDCPSSPTVVTTVVTVDTTAEGVVESSGCWAGGGVESGGVVIGEEELDEREDDELRDDDGVGVGVVGVVGELGGTEVGGVVVGVVVVDSELAVLLWRFWSSTPFRTTRLPSSLAALASATENTESPRTRRSRNVVERILAGRRCR